jgi:hypothetical protein
MLENPELVAAWGSFLAGFHWQGFATATFSKPVSLEQARDAARQWIAGLGLDTYAFVGIEEGRLQGRTHLHALVGGLFDGRRDAAGFLAREAAIARLSTSWQRGRWSPGNVLSMPYDPARGARWYVAKCPAEAEIIGELRRHRRRG